MGTCLPRATEPYPDLWQSVRHGRRWHGQCFAHVPSLHLARLSVVMRIVP